MIELTHDVLDPERVTATVCKDANGAVVTFLGTTRDVTAKRKVLYLEYEAYQPMAEAKLGEIVEEIRQKWPIQDISVAHRLGRLEIGDISLVVAIGSPHREAAFQACGYVVDRIKQTVPIWKKEYFEGGEVWIESPEFFETHQVEQARVED